NIVIKNLIKNGVIEEFEYETFRKCENENDFPQDVEELKLSENQENIKNLIKKMKNSKIIKELFILPTEFSDGFYYCILEKIS
ncbi:MAG TPA: hypothetical protein PKD00_03390, partial [Burkholderiales bacterium]|nr:hypothetical protein [Burkholderiales bacterium]